MPGLLLKHLESGGKQIKQTDKTVGYETEDIFQKGASLFTTKSIRQSYCKAGTLKRALYL